ncbi:MAG: rod shape-determining protein RodA [Saprospiraceae bacterium]|nr:rod shape-determining protein RodA [Saprospiraceae bacterium]
MRSKREAEGIRNIDRITFSIFLAFVAVGWLMVYAVSYSREADISFISTSAGKQLIWVGISLLVFAIIFILDWKVWQTFAYLFYILGIVLLVAVLFFGTTIKGATAWFTFGGFSFQPSEVAKFATCLAMSAYLSNYRTNLRTTQSQLIAFGILLLPIALIMLQPDAGSATVFLSFLIVLYREGLSPNYYVVGFFSATLLVLSLVIDPIYIITTLTVIGIGILAYNFEDNRRYSMLGAITVAVGAYLITREGWGNYALIATLFITIVLAIVQWRMKLAKNINLVLSAIILGAALSFAASFAFNEILKPHQQDRLNVWLQPSKADPRGSLYNVYQSRLAIGSGGLQGKGYLKGTLTKLNYVPEQSTDFIFCTIGEEQGFIGSFGIIALFTLFLYRITIIAERQRSNFSRHYAYCVAGILFVHIFINIGMTMNLMPIIGIPLPFISKGGSSLLGFTVMIAVLLKLDSNRYKL